MYVIQIFLFKVGILQFALPISIDIHIIQQLTINEFRNLKKNATF